MKLLDLHIHGFGKFHDRTVTFQDGLNVIYGQNEAGKSTFHTFIRGMLFGIDKQRGRASRNDLYSKYEPWENSGTYEGTLRLEHEGSIYRIERCFQKNNKSLTVVNETLGREVSPAKPFLDDMLCGLNETTYNNTISIGQLKSATDEGMVSELHNYIANMNTSGNMALNITKASAFLKNQKKHLEAQMVPDAARSYTALIGEIKALEREIAAPEYENQIPSYKGRRDSAKSLLEQKQNERERLLSDTARDRAILSQHQFTTLSSITEYQKRVEEAYESYEGLEKACRRTAPKVLQILMILLATVLLGASGYLYLTGQMQILDQYFYIPSSILCAGAAGTAALLYLIALAGFISMRRKKKNLALYAQIVQEAFNHHIGDPSISDETLRAFNQKMGEYQILSTTIVKSEARIVELANEASALQSDQYACSEAIETQQKIQWELEKMLETLGSYKTQAEGLKHILSENERISQEIEAINLAQETMTDLSTSIKDSFGLYLNKAASELIAGITDGAYTSMSVDENLDVFLNTRKKLVPLAQVSSGTMDQVYLALRLAAAKLIQDGSDRMPLIFDDSFALYDDGRLRSALNWIIKAYGGQIIIFTCHQREAKMLEKCMIPYHMITI